MMRIHHDTTKTNHRRKRCVRNASQIAVLLGMFFLLSTGVAANFTKPKASNKNTRHRLLAQKRFRSSQRDEMLHSYRTTESTVFRHQIIGIRGGSTAARKRIQPSLAEKETQRNPTQSALPNDVPTTSEISPSWGRGDMAVFRASSFLSILALSLVAFAPAPALVAEIGADRATSMLSIVAASAALTEMIMSPAFGSLLDSVGRKPALTISLISVAAVHGLVCIHASVLTICAAKFVGMLSLGSFFTATQVIVSDITLSDPKLMSSTLGLQFALIGLAYFVGAITAGWLSESGLSITYGASMVVCALTAALVSFGMRETLLPSKQIPFRENKTMLRKQLLQSPWSSCTRILTRHSKEVRILAILIMIQSLPSQMRETFQIVARSEWDLNTKDFSSFVAVIGIFNIVANIAGSQMVGRLGIKFFTAVATLSSILAPIGASFFSFRGLMAGTILGCLGSAQMLGVTAALYAEGAKSNVPQGELAGERSAFLALAKVVGPIWYGTLYVRGKKVLGTGFLPFYFNIGCGLAAFVISQRYLPP